MMLCVGPILRRFICDRVNRIGTIGPTYSLIGSLGFSSLLSLYYILQSLLQHFPSVNGLTLSSSFSLSPSFPVSAFLPSFCSFYKTTKTATQIRSRSRLQKVRPGRHGGRQEVLHLRRRRAHHQGD